MNIRITRTVKLHQNILKRVIAELLPINGPMTFIEERTPLFFQVDKFEWDTFFEKCTEYRQSNQFNENDFLIVLTELRNNANWFSSFSMTGERTIFIHASDWENYIYSEPEFPIAYEVVANVLQSESFKKIGNDVFKYVHEDPIGCINDMCGWKPDITLKLRTGDICPDCLSVFSTIIQKEIIEQSVSIFESLRKRMLFNKAWQKPMSFEENLPFTIAITKRKLGTTLEPFRKMLMLIDHFDSIVRTTVLMLTGLTQTKQQMEEFLKERNLHLLPSLGNWVDALAVLAKLNAENFPELQLPRDFSSKVQEVIRLANDNKITYIRNEKRGHGYIDCQDSSYKELFSQCIIAVENIEQLLSPLFYRFNYYHTINLKRVEGNKFKVIAHLLSGSNPAFIEKEIITEFEKIEDLPIEDRFYLVTPDLKKWIDLNPYFKYGECNVCHHNRLLVYDGIYMLDPYIGHRFQIDKNEICS
jgi:hypothetical protein